MSKEELLELYQSLWNNRVLMDESKIAEQILDDAIVSELLDKNTHPRLRKSKEEKFFYAMKRIVDSTIPDSSKLELMKHYIKIIQEL